MLLPTSRQLALVLVEIVPRQAGRRVQGDGHRMKQETPGPVL